MKKLAETGRKREEEREGGTTTLDSAVPAFGCPLFFVAVLTTLPCRRFGYSPFILSPFGIIAVLVSPF